MKAILANLIVVLFSLSAWAQTEEVLGYWADTGYGLSELWSEPELQPNNCMSEALQFSGCLMALSQILAHIEDQNLVIELTDENTLTILAVSEGTLPSEDDREALKDYADARRQKFQRAYELGLSESFLSLRRQTQRLAMEHIPVLKQAYVSGSAFNSFLHETQDPHSSLVPDEMLTPKASNYFGIGAFIGKVEVEDSPWKDSLAIKPMESSPADQAGLKEGDLILKVDGVSVKDETVDEAVARIKGLEGTTVNLEVRSLCTGEIKEVPVTRGRIQYIPNWTEESRFVSLSKSDRKELICSNNSGGAPSANEPQALYVPLTSFLPRRGQDMCGEFKDLQQRDLSNPSSLGMIIDLRGNTGGRLDIVSCMLDSLIVDTGVMIEQVPVERGEVIRNPNPFTMLFSTTHFSEAPVFQNLDGEGTVYNRNIVVLVDGGSASASEIFAGTIQDMKRGFVVGQKTFGKGSVQSLREHQVSPELSSPGDAPLVFKSTTAIYTLNSGRSPQHFGILPDFEYTNLGDVPETPEGAVGEASMYRTIVFDDSAWEQTRPDLVHEVESCARIDESSQSKAFLEKVETDGIYKLPFVANFQMTMAKDVLKCAPQRADEVVALPVQ